MIKNQILRKCINQCFAVFAVISTLLLSIHMVIAQDEFGNDQFFSDVSLIGELKQWHRIGFVFSGPFAKESDTVNPFTDYRVDLTLTSPSGQILKVPGHFAADGNAAETSATEGNQWRVYFSPPEEGLWSYTLSFRQGAGVAVSADPVAGTAVLPWDGYQGSFSVVASDKVAPDLRSKGLLRYVGERYYQFAGNKEYFLKGGTDSPETFLAYKEFDGTSTTGAALHLYTPHLGDAQATDPTWKGGKGKGILGAVNYLSSRGANSIYFLTMNVNGDGKNVWPWTSSNAYTRFDVSKLDQWELVFSHMEQKGIVMHVILQEQENDQLLDGGDLGPQRKLYFRELISRFGHHLGLMWNLGEENSNTDAQRKSFANYFDTVDPYRHPVKVHTFPSAKSTVYTPLLGFPAVHGASLQSSLSNSRKDALTWIGKSKAAGHAWVVDYDEQNPASTGVKPDKDDPNHDSIRTQALWGNLTAGGGGVEYYFGYSYAHNDLNLEDFRSRDKMWIQTQNALNFFQTYLPFAKMQNNDALSSGKYVLAQPGQVYAVYLPSGGSASLDLKSYSAKFFVRWYNPKQGGALQQGTIQTIQGPGVKNLGSAPFTGDSVALVTLDGVVPPPDPTPELAVTRLVLVNADTNKDIGNLVTGETVSFVKLGTTHLNVRADAGSQVLSVRFGLDGNSNYRIESARPYALAGDSKGNYNSWTPTKGTHTVQATPFSQKSAAGDKGPTLTVSFNVVD